MTTSDDDRWVGGDLEAGADPQDGEGAGTEVTPDSESSFEPEEDPGT